MALRFLAQAMYSGWTDVLVPRVSKTVNAYQLTVLPFESKTSTVIPGAPIRQRTMSSLACAAA